MKRKLLTRINAFIALLLGALGVSSCNNSVPEAKYGPPEDLYGIPYTELNDTVQTEPEDVVEAEDPQP